MLEAGVATKLGSFGATDTQRKGVAVADGVAERDEVRVCVVVDVVVLVRFAVAVPVELGVVVEEDDVLLEGVTVAVDVDVIELEPVTELDGEREEEGVGSATHQENGTSARAERIVPLLEADTEMVRR